jgi:molybdate transport system ATP-binding protein
LDGNFAAQTADGDHSIRRPEIEDGCSTKAFVAFTPKSESGTLRSGGSPDNDALVELKGVSVRYGPVQVLTDVDWTVHRGERWALLGPNGAGKSTLLSLILADNPQAYSNQVRLFGRRRGSGETIWEIKKKIGWVSPELQNHYPPTTGCRSVVESGLYDSIGLYSKGSTEVLERVEKLLGAIGIGHLGERPFGAVSTGEQRLVLLARALVKEPELLILDEPGQGMDGSLGERLKSFLETYCRSVPVTLIYVTHVPSEIPNVVEHTLRLDHGRVLHERDTVD